LHCLHAALLKGRKDCAPLLHGLLLKRGVRPAEVNPENWEQSDEAHFQHVVTMDEEKDIDKTRNVLKAKVLLALSTLSSLTSKKLSEFEQRAAIVFREKVAFAEFGIPHFPFQAFSFDFDEDKVNQFKEANRLLAESTQQGLSNADSELELEQRFQKYQAEFNNLERSFLLKIKETRDLRKILFCEKRLLSSHPIEAADQLPSLPRPFSILKNQLSQPDSRQSLEQAIKGYNHFKSLESKSEYTADFLLERGIRSTLEAEISRLQEKSEAVSKNEKVILDKRIDKIKNFLKQGLKQDEAILKARLFDLSKQMSATKWRGLRTACFFKAQSTGESIIYKLAKHLQDEVPRVGNESYLRRSK